MGSREGPANFGLRCAYAHGVSAIRTHLDSVPQQAGLSWPAFREMRAEWVGRIALQGVSLVPLMRGEMLETQLPAFNETGVWLTDLPGTPINHLRYPHLPQLLEISNKKIGMISLKPKYVDIIIAAKDRMVRVGDWKLTYQPLTNGAMYRLFNIRKDPGCLHNVMEQQPRIAEQLKCLLDRWLDDDPKSGRHGAVTVSSPRSTGQEPFGEIPAVSGNLS